MEFRDLAGHFLFFFAWLQITFSLCHYVAQTTRNPHAQIFIFSTAQTPLNGCKCLYVLLEGYSIASRRNCCICIKSILLSHAAILILHCDLSSFILRYVCIKTRVPLFSIVQAIVNGTIRPKYRAWTVNTHLILIVWQLNRLLNNIFVSQMY